MSAPVTDPCTGGPTLEPAPLPREAARFLPADGPDVAVSTEVTQELLRELQTLRQRFSIAPAEDRFAMEQRCRSKLAEAQLGGGEHFGG